MKMSRVAPLALCLFSPFVACDCGGDDVGGGEGTGSDTTEGGTAGSSSSTTVGMTAGEGTSASAGTVDDSGGSGEASSGGATEVFITGTVVDYTQGMMTLPDVEVSVFDMPGVTATSDAMGVFTLGPLPPGAEIAIVAAPSTDYFGSVLPYTVPDADIDDAELPQVARDFVDAQIMLIADQMPAMADLTQGIMIVGNRLMADIVGAVIDVQPAPPMDTYYAPDSMGAPVVGASTLAFDLLPVVVYFNVPTYQPGEVTVTATHPMSMCSVLHPEFPTLGEHVSFVLVEC
jgi:hypothetical protein